MDDRISIIVSTFKRKEKLKRLLDSFSRLRCCCPLEIIIVDNASDDGTRDVVEKWIPTIDFAEVKYHILAEPAPLVYSRNVGISLSTGNILAFTDDDCIVDPSWVDKLYQQLISCPDYAGVGGKVLPVGNDIFSLYNTVYRVLEPPAHINVVITANCMLWKQPVIDAGMFDEYFLGPGGEEIALCMKLWLKGYRFGFEEGAVVHHEYRNSLKNFITTFFNYGYGERMIFEHQLTGYLRYIPYPEQMNNYLAFRNLMLFQVIFSLRMVGGIFQQSLFLGKIPVSYVKKVMLMGLFAFAHFSYHLGRGTFSGTLVKHIKEYLINHPEGLCTLDRDTDGNSRILEIYAEKTPSSFRDRLKWKSTVTIRKQ